MMVNYNAHDCSLINMHVSPKSINLSGLEPNDALNPPGGEPE